MYSLTFNEFQNTMGTETGKDFGSMNMDELLKSIWTPTCNASEFGFQTNHSLPPTLTQKTVDEVWKDMSKESGDDLGDMTLEEFLFKAGVAREDDLDSTQFTSTASNTNAGFGIGFQETEHQNMGFNFFNGALPDAIPSFRYLEEGLNGNLLQELNAAQGRSGSVEKLVDRKQRRMIKNRESAARSRARKQAYTAELETELAKLKEENQDLQKKHVEIMEIQKQQLLEMINKQPESKRRCLRRTHTGP